MIVHETPRLFLETWALSDFDAFAEIARSPEVMQYIAEGVPWTDARIGWFMGLQKAYQDTLGYCNWKLIHREEGELIGFCGISPIMEAEIPEIGWWLKPTYWGHGYAFEAASQVVEAASAVHALNRLVARAYRSNKRSISLMERLGMEYDQVFETRDIGEVLLYRIDLSLHQQESH